MFASMLQLVNSKTAPLNAMKNTSVQLVTHVVRMQLEDGVAALNLRCVSS